MNSLQDDVVAIMVKYAKEFEDDAHDHGYVHTVITAIAKNEPFNGTIYQRDLHVRLFESEPCYSSNGYITPENWLGDNGVNLFDFLLVEPSQQVIV